MQIADYDILREILDDLSIDDIDQLSDYANDCQMVGATRTARYIRNQIQHDTDINLALVGVKLTEDVSGCY